MATTIPSAFDELLSNLRLTATEQNIAAGRVRNIQEVFPQKYVCAKPPWTIGSYGRETIIRWSRDIDLMVALSDAYWARSKDDSRSFLYGIRNVLNAAYGETEVSTKQVAVRMKLGDGLQVDLVPTFEAISGGFYIPNGSGGWQLTNPPYHDALVTVANGRTNFGLKPIVRLMKAWNYANGRHLRSFHLEMIVERIWQNATILTPTPAMVAETLRCASDWVRSSFLDPWTSSGQMIDSYLSAAERDLAARMLDSDAADAKRALDFATQGEIAKAFERWNVVFRRQFPAYG